jgi:hypothetical protein
LRRLWHRRRLILGCHRRHFVGCLYRRW